jgi:hypothetical protein
MSNMLSRDESVEQLDFALKSAGVGVYPDARRWNAD